MRLERPHLFARPDVPEDDGFVPAAGDEDVALWVEGDAEDVRGVGEEGAEDDALRDDGGRGRGWWWSGEVDFERRKGCERAEPYLLDRPDQDQPFVPCRGQVKTIRGECQVVDSCRGPSI